MNANPDGRYMHDVPDPPPEHACPDCNGSGFTRYRERCDLCTECRACNVLVSVDDLDPHGCCPGCDRCADCGEPTDRVDLIDGGRCTHCWVSAAKDAERDGYSTLETTEAP